MIRRRARPWLLLVLPLLLGGCSRRPPRLPVAPEGPDPDDISTGGAAHRASVNLAGPASTRPAPRPPAAAPRGFVATVERPGSATFGVEGTGLVTLRDGTFSVRPGVEGLVRALALGEAGLWVTNYSGLYLLQGHEAPEKRGDHDRPGPVEELALARDGTLWTLGVRGVSRHDGAGFVLFDRTRFDHARVLHGLAVDGSGRAWVSAGRTLHRQERGEWKAADTAEVAGDRPSFDKLASGPDGTVLVSFARGLLACGDRGCRQVAGLRERPSAFAAAPDGRLLVVTRLDRVSILSPEGNATAVDPAQAGFRASAVSFVAADAAGRFWLATDLGVVVLDREGAAVQWEPGQVPEVSGPVRCILLEGEGPSLPVVGPRVRGTVKGRLLRGGVPVEDATVELCKAPSLASPESPCGQAAFKQTGSTDAHGHFSLPAVPVGHYRLAIKAGARWVTTLDGSCCTRVVEGGIFDVGSISLREP